MHWMGSFTGTTAAWVAALISFISVVINTWIPSRHRPQASFTLIEHPIPDKAIHMMCVDEDDDKNTAHQTNVELSKAFHLRNLGDGEGYNLSISFLKCTGMTAIRTDSEDLDFVTNGIYSTHDNLWVLVNEDSLTKSSALEVHWVTPPTRLNHCRYQRIPIPAPPHKWGIVSKLSQTGKQWLQHRSWHYRNRIGRLNF